MALQDSKSIRITRVKSIQEPPIMGVDANAVRERVGARLKEIVAEHGLPSDVSYREKAQVAQHSDVETAAPLSPRRRVSNGR